MDTQQKNKQKHKNWHSTQRSVKLAIVIVGLCLTGYIVCRPLYWRISESFAFSSSSCSPCFCDCSSRPLISLSQGLNNSYADCAKHDPEVSEEMEKSFTELLSDELSMREAEALERQQRADKGLLDAKKAASQYQKEADKCNSGMETCEEARERAELALQSQRKLSSIWEIRARQKGWREKRPSSKS